MHFSKSAVLVCGWDITDLIRRYGEEDEEFDEVIASMRNDGAYAAVSISMVDLTYFAGIVIRSYEDSMPREFGTGELDTGRLFAQAYENIKQLGKWFKPEGLPKVLLAVAI